ncbi:hypothetical protein KJ644_01715 [Candidatus Dependentiae bacterium]|nr:hypothetical protein [Candidatus Dependentiae bacterium]MBU4387169.1 hypothetical protein [Candidatus Dependentiae bacterium]MCG2755926.1 hypothetical protein [Candidatus Dependentiae bacterium]
MKFLKNIMQNFIKTKTYYKYLLSVLLLFAIYGIFYLFFLNPKNYKIDNLNFQLKDLNQQKEIYNKVVFTNKNLNNENLNLNQEFDKLKLDQNLDKNVLNTILVSLEKYSLNCLKYSKLPTIKKGNYKYKVYRFYIQGDFDNLTSFISNDFIFKNLIKIKNIYFVNFEKTGLNFLLDLKIMSFINENKV